MQIPSHYPSFCEYGYQITDQLGINRSGGRFTYKAINTNTNQTVVIKQFCFSEFLDWSGYKAHEREISILQSLDHPQIPRYLDCFETPNGFCLVQEYINAQPLSAIYSFNQEDIILIAKDLLKILIYLQSRIPIIIHRDIKPENILVSTQLKVYLVDFGFARIGSKDLSASSIVVGTSGFMPPEQLLGRELSASSDLYGVGATLACLISGIKSYNFNHLVDETYSIDLNKVLHSSTNYRLKKWLEKMVTPRQSDRYKNAVAALEALTAVEHNFSNDPSFNDLDEDTHEQPNEDLALGILIGGLPVGIPLFGCLIVAILSLYPNNYLLKVVPTTTEYELIRFFMKISYCISIVGLLGLKCYKIMLNKNGNAGIHLLITTIVHLILYLFFGLGTLSK